MPTPHWSDNMGSSASAAAPLPRWTKRVSIEKVAEIPSRICNDNGFPAPGDYYADISRPLLFVLLLVNLARRDRREAHQVPAVCSGFSTAGYVIHVRESGS